MTIFVTENSFQCLVRQRQIEDYIRLSFGKELHEMDLLFFLRELEQGNKCNYRCNDDFIRCRLHGPLFLLDTFSIPSLANSIYLNFKDYFLLELSYTIRLAFDLGTTSDFHIDLDKYASDTESDHNNCNSVFKYFQLLLLCCVNKGGDNFSLYCNYDDIHFRIKKGDVTIETMICPFFHYRRCFHYYKHAFSRYVNKASALIVKYRDNYFNLSLIFRNDSWGDLFCATLRTHEFVQHIKNDSLMDQ